MGKAGHLDHAAEAVIKDRGREPGLELEPELEPQLQVAPRRRRRIVCGSASGVREDRALPKATRVRISRLQQVEAHKRPTTRTASHLVACMTQEQEAAGAVEAARTISHSYHLMRLGLAEAMTTMREVVVEQEEAAEEVEAEAEVEAGLAHIQAEGVHHEGKVFRAGPGRIGRDKLEASWLERLQESWGERAELPSSGVHLPGVCYAGVVIGDT